MGDNLKEYIFESTLYGRMCFFFRRHETLCGSLSANYNLPPYESWSGGRQRSHKQSLFFFYFVCLTKLSKTLLLKSPTIFDVGHQEF